MSREYEVGDEVTSPDQSFRYRKATIVALRWAEGEVVSAATQWGNGTTRWRHVSELDAQAPEKGFGR